MTEKDNINEAVVIAALLHDVGKFAQRAAKNISELPKTIRDARDVLCRKHAEGFYTHLHVLWTLNFFVENASSFPIPVEDVSFSEFPEDTLANMAARHHADNLTPLQEIIKQADWLSAGMDRIRYFDQEDEQRTTVHFRKQKLQSLFGKVDLTETKKDSDYFYDLDTLQTDSSCFPEKSDNNVNLTDQYNKLFHQFTEQFNNMPRDHFLARTLALLELFTAAIPSSTMDIPDISLYDHSRTTAALAIALYEYHRFHQSLNTDAIRNWQENKFLLLSGDLSGIQPFIFRLNTANVRGGSKILRARSFYLQMVSNIVVHRILTQLKMPSLSKIIDAGGRFILLLPNLEPVKSSLETIEKEVDSWFFQRFSGELSMNLNWETEICGNDLKQENFKHILNRLSRAVDHKKRRKYSSFLFNTEWQPENFIMNLNYTDFKRPEISRCQVCGSFPGTETEYQDGSERRICSFCRTEQKIGKWLLQAKLIGISGQKGIAEREIRILHRYSVYLLTEREISHTHHFDEVFVTTDDVSDLSLPRYLLANYVPYFSRDDQALFELVKESDEKFYPHPEMQKTFHHLAKSGIIDPKTLEVTGGKEMLGILKADVDSLGQIFSRGLGDSVSISRYAALSRLLNHFFVGYLMNLLKNSKNRSPDFSNIYTVFAGGDDLVFIGEWKNIIAFAQFLQKAFERYVCGNPDVHLSAGIAHIPPKFPINQGIMRADALLEKAKEGGKNRIALFDTVMTWTEFAEALDFADFLDRQLQQNDAKINNSFLYRLLQYHRQFMNIHSEKENDISDLLYLSHLKYDIARNIVQFDKNTGKVKPEYRRVFDRLQPLMNSKTEDLTLMKTLKVPVFYAMYKNRGRKSTQETNHE